MGRRRSRRRACLGLGGQPVAQPNGNVIVPYEGGAASVAPVDRRRRHVAGLVPVSQRVTDHGVAGNLRTSPLPSAEVDAEGKVYVVWQDCRFRSGLRVERHRHDHLDGRAAWTAVVRIPIDATTSGVDHFIPGIAVDRSTSGSTARLALGVLLLPGRRVHREHMRPHGRFRLLDRRWDDVDAAAQVAGPFKLAWIAQTDQGPMVGDYISTSFAGGPLAFPVFAIAKPPVNGVFNERAASARFDVTIPQAGVPSPVRRDPIRFRGRASAKAPLVLATRR